MFKTIKRALPIMVFITLSSGSIGLSLQASPAAILIGGVSAALITALLLYAAISWDDAFQHKQMETLQLASVVNHAMDAVVIFDARGRVLYANPSARDIYELPESCAVPPDITMLGLPADTVATVLEQVLGGSPWNGELSRAGAPGNPQTDLVSLFRLEEFQGHTPALASISRDLTQRKHLERRLQHSQKLAAVGELAAGIAHEINNPMAAIQSQIGLAGDLLNLQQAATNDAVEVLNCLREADRQVQRCSNIVDSLLRFSRHDGVHLSRLDARTPVQQALKFVRCLSKMQQLQLTCTVADDLPAIHSDSDSVTQVLVNLIVNAADATAQRGPVEIRCRRHSDVEVAIDVIDQGEGIDPHIRDRVFEPFFTTKAPGAGTGLGLSISYGLARSLGGALNLQGLPDHGTCATLLLPVHDPATHIQAPTV